MEEILKELKEELLNKEMALLELDNVAETIIGTNESLYDYLNDVLEQKSFGYIYDYENDNNFIIEFNILDDDYEEKLEDKDYKFYMKIKITNIWIS